jgi:hypothetical protein
VPGGPAARLDGAGPPAATEQEELQMCDGHDHAGHEHGHTHTHAHERYADRSHPEFVVLEIGGELGALIVHTDPELHGLEVEISRTGADDQRQHKDVLERPLRGAPSYSAVFDQIPEGSYTLWVDDVARARDVYIAGGSVCELDWCGQRADSEALAGR